LVLALLDASDHCEALLAEADSASCAACDEAEFVVAFADFPELEDELLFEAEFSAAASCAALLDVAAWLFALFLLEPLADAELDANAPLAAAPVVEEALLFSVELAALLAAAELLVPLSFVAPCPLSKVDAALWLAALLAAVVDFAELSVEVRLMAALPLFALFAEALSAALEVAAALFVLPLLADAFRLADADFTLLD
jgi:hypothetical protein